MIKRRAAAAELPPSTCCHTFRATGIGRLELGYSFRQLAAVDGRASPDTVRMALKRALVRLAAEMGEEET